MNAEIHSDVSELLGTIPVCSANSRDESLWMTYAIIHPFFFAKSAPNHVKAKFCLGVWILVPFPLWSENCLHCNGY